MREPGPSQHAPRRDLESWWQDHSELDYMIDALLTMIDRGSAAAASSALEDLAGSMQAHLDVEEEVYFPLIERLAPEHSATLREARLTHLELRERIEALRQHLALGELEDARSALTKLLHELRAHEQMEARLIADLARTEPR
ncbi:MAG: hemerythrin domain-containing protein [Deltaproteobacteria bacterium]|nr:MAG: hemerythrin domain-containing protein [Deltaproteobacteria bacterium]